VGSSTNSETGERAAILLEGGLRAGYEGLRDSSRPCARVLSVAGFLVIFHLFPGSGGVYSEVRKGGFTRAEASALQPPD